MKRGKDIAIDDVPFYYSNGTLVQLGALTSVEYDKHNFWYVAKTKNEVEFSMYAADVYYFTDNKKGIIFVPETLAELSFIKELLDMAKKDTQDYIVDGVKQLLGLN